MNLLIKEGNESYLKEYTLLLQTVYEATYTAPELGITKECFSKEIFNSEDTQQYLKSNLVVNENQITWLAFDDLKLIGSITIQKKDQEYELKGFYVVVEYQQKGIGTKLFNRAKEFAAGHDISLDIYAHNIRTIIIYEKWGFEVDLKKGEFYRHWPEWPDEVKAKCIYMRLSRNKHKAASSNIKK